MALGILALVGTRKGLFVLRGDEHRRSWQAEGPLLADSFGRAIKTAVEAS